MGDERQKVTGEKGDGRRRSEEYKLGRRVGELGAVEKAWVRKDVGLESTDYIAEVSDVNVSTIVSVSCSGSDGRSARPQLVGGPKSRKRPSNVRKNGAFI